jgi:hypothetical protein
MDRPIRINLGGEGEVPGALNQQGIWVFSNDWASSREGKTFAELRIDGHSFVISDNRLLPFEDSSIDEVYTNAVPIDGRDTFLGPPIQSSEITRVLKISGKWYRDGQLLFEKT